MAEYRVFVSAPAERDLREILAYIAMELSVPDTAADMLEMLDQAVQSLQDYPKRNALVSDERLAQMGFRKLLAKNYIVFYVVDEASKVVDVVRVLYARRDWEYLL